MRIVAATPVAYALPLAAPWPGAGLSGTRRGWLLRIDTADGRRGFGECAPLPSHGSESATAADQALRDCCAALPGQAVAAALAALDAPAAFVAPAARAAVECALLDLAAQGAGMPLWRYLAPDAQGGAVAVNAFAGNVLGTTPAQLAQALATGCSVIKLKLGGADPEREIAALRGIAAALPASVRLRLDANRAWDIATAARVGAALADLPIESLEEPLTAPTPAALRRLQDALPFALAVDESWPEFEVEDFFVAPPVRRLVLKLATHGGLRPALATARRAQAAAVECVLTTGVDGACATLAAAQLAAALGNGLAHGLATSSWLAEDIGVPPTVAAGRIALPETPGLGFRACSS